MAPVSQPTAEAAYRAEDYEDAAASFASIAAGQQPGDPGRARFWLAKTYLRLDLPSAALSVFGEIVDAGPSDPGFRPTLPWLAALRSELPEGSGVLEMVGRYPLGALENPKFDDIRDELYYVLGKARYRQGRLEQAVSLLGAVPKKSEFFIPAQYFIGVAQTRRFRGPEALAAFKRVLHAHLDAQRGIAGSKVRPARLDRWYRRLTRLRARGKRRRFARVSNRIVRRHGIRYADLQLREDNRIAADRAYMAMGYIFYQVGKFATATRYFSRLPQSSPYWLDGVFAAAWSEFRNVEIDPDHGNLHYQKALGYIHTLGAPYFDDSLYPEAPVLASVIYFFNCRYQTARTKLDEFERKYPPVAKSLRTVLANTTEDFDLYRVGAAIRQDASKLPPAVAPIATRLLQDRELDRAYRYVSQVREQENRLGKMPQAWLRSTAGLRADEALSLARSVAQERAGALTRQRLSAAVAEIRRLQREALKIEYEILERIKQSKEGDRGRRARPRVDADHERYDYNGEYWPDELGHYYYEVTSLCPK